MDSHVRQYRVTQLAPDDTPEITENMEPIALYDELGNLLFDAPDVGPASDVFTPASGFTLGAGKYYKEGALLHVVGLKVLRTASTAVALGDSASIGKFAAAYDPPADLAGVEMAMGFIFKSDGTVVVPAVASVDTNAGTGLTAKAQGAVSASANTEFHFPQLLLPISTKFTG